MYWECKKCDTENSDKFEVCEVCDSERLYTKADVETRIKSELSRVKAEYGKLYTKAEIETRIKNEQKKAIIIGLFVLFVLFVVSLFMSDDSQKDQQIAELSSENSSLQAQLASTACEDKACPTTICDYSQKNKEIAKLSLELNEANSVIISLSVENLRAQNTCDDIHISVGNDNALNITGVSGSRERIAKLKERARNSQYVSLNTFDVKYIESNRCVIKVSYDWAIIAQNSESLDEITYQEGVVDYLSQLPNRSDCSKVGEIIQDNDDIYRHFFTDGKQPQIWALFNGTIGFCRGEENEGVYDWSFRRGHDGYSALLVIKVQQ